MNTDSVLGHTLARAFLETGDQEPSAWKLAKLTPKAARVTSLIVFWSLALKELERDSLGVEEYVAWSADSRATVHRHLVEFRDLYPDHDGTPNVIARAVLAAAGESRPSHQTLVPA